MSKPTGLTGKHPAGGAPMRLVVCYSSDKPLVQIGFEEQMQGKDMEWVALGSLEASPIRAYRHFMQLVSEPQSEWWECICENEWERLHHKDWMACPQCGWIQSFSSTGLASAELLGKYGPGGTQTDNWAVIEHTVHAKDSAQSTTFHSNAYLPDIARSLTPTQMGKFIAEYVAHIGGTGWTNGLSIGEKLADVHRASYAVAVTMLIAIMHRMNKSEFVDARNKEQKDLLEKMLSVIGRKE